MRAQQSATQQTTSVPNDTPARMSVLRPTMKASAGRDSGGVLAGGGAIGGAAGAGESGGPGGNAGGAGGATGGGLNGGGSGDGAGDHIGQRKAPSSAHWLAKPIAKLLVMPDENSFINLETANNAGTVRSKCCFGYQHNEGRDGRAPPSLRWSLPALIALRKFREVLGARAAQAPPRRSQVFTQTRNQDGGAVLLCKRAQLVCTA